MIKMKKVVSVEYDFALNEFLIIERSEKNGKGFKNYRVQIRLP